MKISNIGLAAFVFAAAPLAISSSALAQTAPGSSTASGSVSQSPSSSEPVNSTVTPSTSAPSVSSSASGTSRTSDVSVEKSPQPSPSAAAKTAITPPDNATVGTESNRDNEAKGKLSQGDIAKKEGVAKVESSRDRNDTMNGDHSKSGKEMNATERHHNGYTSNRSTQYRKDWSGRHQGRRWVGTGPAIGFGFGFGERQYGNRYYDESYAFSPGGNNEAYCAAQFQSYDPESGTYLGYDGRRHFCP